MRNDDGRGDYCRVKDAFVPLVQTRIRNVNVAIGQLRESGQISQNMVLLIERQDYSPGEQFICLRLSTIRQIGTWVVRKSWWRSRRLTSRERAKLDLTALVQDRNRDKVVEVNARSPFKQLRKEDR